jgi:uncharacterized phage protein (TIGR01671 family)
MQTEIKFRAWDDHNKVMKTYTLKQLAEEDRFSYDTEFEAIQSGFDNWKWMQYTGLKDKNGKEIYEGDVITWLNRENERFFSILIFDQKHARFEGNGFYQGALLSKFYYLPADLCPLSEVIGNIYENPELLAAPPTLQGNG